MTRQIALEGAALGHAELLLSGAYAPLTGFMTSIDARSVDADETLADGTPWPAPVTLIADGAVGEQVELTDPEGAPVATLTVTERWDSFVAGPLTPVCAVTYGAFRSLRRTPAEVSLPPGAVAVLADRALLTDDLLALDELAVALVMVPAEEALVRAVRAAVAELKAPAELVVLPLPEPRLAEIVAKNYGAERLIRLAHTDAYATAEKLLETGAQIPAEIASEAVATHLRELHPPRQKRGLVVFFTGLSGSGKSTVARGLVDRLHERGGRTVTMLDGDVVRRMLSQGLTFSRADRDLNIRRIGFVAAEVARHGGIAVCAPIAPYAATRAEVRAMVEAAGGELLLVYVSTPLEVCEARDRKGLYAKARAGLIPEFTGISDPYEAPTDADLELDTSVVSERDAIDAVLALLSK